MSPPLIQYEGHTRPSPVHLSLQTQSPKNREEGRGRRGERRGEGGGERRRIEGGGERRERERRSKLTSVIYIMPKHDTRQAQQPCCHAHLILRFSNEPFIVYLASLLGIETGLINQYSCHLSGCDLVYKRFVTTQGYNLPLTRVKTCNRTRGDSLLLIIVTLVDCVLL